MATVEQHKRRAKEARAETLSVALAAFAIGLYLLLRDETLNAAAIFGAVLWLLIVGLTVTGVLYVVLRRLLGAHRLIR